ncbi:MAG TPA: biotin/lipoyl-binding protein [Stellaceae bacterium]|nr:biotin/lipoyl-binding protein [Stellaceae bacterium]
MRRRLVVLTLALICAAGPSTRAQATFTVHLADTTDEKAVFATVESPYVVPARARIDGTIASLSVHQGDAVREGQVIAVVADQKLLLRIEVPPGPPVRATLLAEIYGPDEKTRLAVAQEVKKLFKSVPFIVDVTDSYGHPRPRLRISIDQDDLEYFGVEQDDRRGDDPQRPDLSGAGDLVAVRPRLVDPADRAGDPGDLCRVRDADSVLAG